MNLGARIIRRIEAERRKVLPTSFERTADRWFKEATDDRLLDYDGVGPSSVVAEIGGYQGKWAAAMADRYGCKVITSEPVAEFATAIAARRHPLIQVLSYGVGDHTYHTDIVLADDGSSTHRGRGSTTRILIQDAALWLQDLPATVDVLLVNCEGGEYELLPRMIQLNALRRFRHIAIQFHKTRIGDGKRRAALVRAMGDTHELVTSYPFIWDIFVRRM